MIEVVPNPNMTAAWIEARSIPEPNTGCWLWLGSMCGHYGNAPIGGRNIGAHRVSYVVHHGPIPSGLVVMHRCDQPTCVNPQHLTVGTTADNNRDRSLKGRTNRRDSTPPERRPRGVRHWKARLTDSDVLAIRQRLADGEERMAVAREYGIGWSTIDHIAKGRTWRHLLPQAGALMSVSER